MYGDSVIIVPYVMPVLRWRSSPEHFFRSMLPLGLSVSC